MRQAAKRFHWSKVRCQGANPSWKILLWWRCQLVMSERIQGKTKVHPSLVAIKDGGSKGHLEGKTSSEHGGSRVLIALRNVILTMNNHTYIRACMNKKK